MKTFKQFLGETFDYAAEEQNAEDIANLIKKNCQPFLRESHFDAGNSSTFMYRGMKLPGNPKFMQLMNRKREPVDSISEVSEMLDDYLFDKFGAKFRSEGYFCIGNHSSANDYGAAHIVFPIGEFKYCWSEFIGDAFIYFDNSKFAAAPQGQHIIAQYLENGATLDSLRPDTSSLQLNTEDPRWIKACRAYLDDFDPYQNTKLNVAIARRTRQEIMIQSDSYYVLDYNHGRFCQLVLDNLKRQ